jgi:alanine dehydrogenase
VQILELSLDRLQYLDDLFGSRVELLYSTRQTIEQVVPEADLLIGAVLVTGKRAPRLVSRATVARMRPGSVIVDVAVDQGGCIETLRPTSHSQPIYIEEGVVHYGVPNMPGAVPWTATQALNNATLPYVLKLANLGYPAAAAADPALALGVNIERGRLVHPAVQQVFADLIHA